MRKFWGLLVSIVLTLFCAGYTYAQSAAIDNGLTWIQSTQNESGSWGGDSGPTTTEFFSTVSIIDFLYANGQTGTTAYQNGILWLQSASIENSAYIAYRIKSLSTAGLDISADSDLLLTYKNSDNGWGGYTNHISSNFHTTLALQALKKINYSDQTTIDNAVSYL